MGNAVFAALALLNLAAKMPRQQLMPVTDAQHRNVGRKQCRIDIGTAGQQDTGRAARDNDAFATGQHAGWRVAGLHIGVHAKLTHTARDQMGILATGV